MVKSTIGDALKEGIALLNKNSIDTAGIDARVLMCSVLSCDKLYLTVHRDDPLSQTVYEKYSLFISRRSTGEPVGYIINSREFMSLDFYVDKNVLIPRPDTEILVEKVIEHFDGRECAITDFCTGSGAIAVSLAKYLPRALVTGIDISQRALEVAGINACRHGVSDRCSFVLHDALTPYNTLADAVISNPPYIPSRDVLELEKTVKDFEPVIALDGGDDGLMFYRAIVKNTKYSLKPGGLLAFEVGCGLSKEVCTLMESDFRNISVLCDLAGIERVVYGIKKEEL